MGTQDIGERQGVAMTGEGERIATLEAQVETLIKQVDDLNTDRKRMMRWGVMALGSAVVGLGGYVWSLR